MQRRTYRRYERRRRRRTVRLWAVLAVVLVVLITVLALILFAPKEEGTFGRELKKLDVPAGSEVMPFAGGTVFVDSQAQNLYYLNRNGEAKWGFSGTVNGMKMAVSANRLAIYYSAKLQMIGSDGTQIYSKVYDYPIQNLRMSNEICAFLQVQGTVSNVTVVDAAGNVVDVLTEPSGQKLLSFGVFGERGVWLIMADTESLQPTYRFYTYRYETSKLITVSYTTADQLIYFPVFYADSISLIGTGDIISIDYTGKFLRRVRCSGFEFTQQETPYTGPVLPLVSGKLSADAVMFVDSEFDTFQIAEEEPILTTAITDRFYYIFTANHLYTYSVGKMARKCYTLPETVSLVRVGLENQAVLCGEQGHYLLVLE